MTVKIYVNDDNTATFECPKCHKTGIKDLTKYFQQKKTTRLKAKCACGYSYGVFLEKRKKFRKQANLPGTYKFSANNSDTQEYIGSMTVKDISYTGLRIKIQMMPRFKVGDTLYVEFRLDDTNRSQIKKKVLVKNMKGLSAGLAYTSPQNHDSVLGFYLFN
ncbi:MAG: PilZ domain-containing protein [Desulfobacteraceae bacterium]|nr:PilZ domain-containing protein [Desulfobacteraceae bacterium]MBC2755578.1 PilZ domain-containing protein [Desulfobacteraceae bacterium]